MYKYKKKVAMIVILAFVVSVIAMSVTKVYAVSNNTQSNNTSSETSNNTSESNNTNSSTKSTNNIKTSNETLKPEDSTASTLVDLKYEQLKTLEDYKRKYGSDTYGTVAYVLNIVRVYSIPFGLVGIAFCAIYEYVIGMKRLDIRDKGFNSMIALITIIIICQILPLIFTIVVKSRD